MVDELSSYGYSVREIEAMRKAARVATGRDFPDSALLDALERDDVCAVERGGASYAWYCDSVHEAVIGVADGRRYPNAIVRSK